MCHMLAKLSLQNEVWDKWKHFPGKVSSSKLYRSVKEASPLLSDTLPRQSRGRDGMRRNILGWKEKKEEREEKQVVEGL